MSSMLCFSIISNNIINIYNYNIINIIIFGGHLNFFTGLFFNISHWILWYLPSLSLSTNCFWDRLIGRRVILPTDKHDDRSHLWKQHQTQAGWIYFKIVLSLEAVLVIIETVSCFKRKLFELHSLIHLTASVYCTHPSSCAARGLRDSLERFLAYSSSIFILKHKQQDEELSAAWLKGGQTETASVVGRKYFNTNTFLTGILKNPTLGIALTLVHRQPSRAPALLYSSSFSERLFTPSLWDLLIFAPGCVQPR